MPPPRYGTGASRPFRPAPSAITGVRTPDPSGSGSTDEPKEEHDTAVGTGHPLMTAR